MEAEPELRELPAILVLEPDPGRPARSDQGYIDLRWTPDPPPPEGSRALHYLLQQGESPAFETPAVRYQGPDLGSVLTGFAEGDYWFRIRAVDPGSGGAGPWSDTVHLEVRYMPMGRVALFLVAGAAVFALTLGAILTGHARARGENPDSPEEAS